MSKGIRITKQDVAILKAYNSEFGKLPAKMVKFQKAMETTEKLLHEFAQVDYTATIFLDDQVTPALETVSGKLRNFSKSTYKVSVSVDMTNVYTDIHAAERKIRRMQLKPGYSGRYMTPYAGTSVSGAGATPAQTTSSESSFDSVMSMGSAIVTVNSVKEIYGNYTKLKNKPTEYAKFKAGLPEFAANAVTAYGFLDGGADIAEGIFSTDNAYDRTYKIAEGATVMAGSFAGMKAGAALGSTGGPIGMLAGAAGGYLLGKLLSEPVADSFADGIAGAEKYADVSTRAAEKTAQLRAEQKALAGARMDEAFGKITLSAKEVSQVVGELFDTGQTVRINNAAAAINDLQGSFMDLQQADYGLQKTLWLSGAEASAGNMDGLMESTRDFGESSRKSLLDNQYAEREAVKVLLPESDAGKEMLKGIDERFQEKQEKLDVLLGKLNKKTLEATSDGVVDSGEQTEIDGIRQEVLQLLYGESGSKDENEDGKSFQAAIEKMKLGLSGEYSKESFAAIIKEGAAAVKERINALENDYSQAAVGKTDEEKQTLLWGNGLKGETDGLYKSELDTYRAIIEPALNEFTDKNSKKLGFFDNLYDEEGKLQVDEETVKNIRLLEGNRGDREMIKEYSDSMEPIYSEMKDLAKKIKDEGGEIPQALQQVITKMELLGSIGNARAYDWYSQYYKPPQNDKKKKNTYTYEYLNHPKAKYRGGIIAPAFAEGGYVHGGAQLITVAEEGTPEAIIPLGRHRRKRALQLFNQVGGYLQAPGFSPKGFAAGGIVGGSIGSIGSAGGSGAPVAIEVGGVEIRVEAKDGQSLVETIRENKEAISEEIAGVFNAAFRGQFANTPAAGGAGL